jgi:hypothetical protein
MQLPALGSPANLVARSSEPVTWATIVLLQTQRHN